MNLLDILIAKKKSFTGETESLIRRANAAMAQANTVADKIEDASEALEAATTAQEAAEAANSRAQEIADDLESIKNDITGTIDDEIEELNLVQSISYSSQNTSNTKTITSSITTTSGDSADFILNKNYKTTGQNEDGSMTQKAITTALNSQKEFLENKINNIEVSGGNSSGNISGILDNATPGNLIIVGVDGDTIAESSINQNDIIKIQMAIGNYVPKSSIGIEVDYDNKSVNRAQEAISLSAGADFDKYSMYGGRKRCIVSDIGEIISFYGDSGYTENGSLGQVMVYQPKFYYMRMPLKVTKSNNRFIINQEVIYISDVKQAGFTIHPAFLDVNDNELDYILLPAYQGSSYDLSANSYNLNDSQNINFDEDLLCSIAGAKPISGTSQALNITNANKLATNRGSGWKITNLMTESVNQMLMIIEFGSFNLQSAFNKGITQLSNYNNVNISCITGSTSTLGSISGMASSTSDSNNTYYTEGKCAITYRGVENPYGNIWRFIGDTKIVKENNLQFLKYKDNHGIEKTFASPIPTRSDWISYFGYDEEASWAFVPTVCQNANSAVPVGDYTYIDANSNEDKCCVIGGKGSAGDYAGPFYYGLDYAYNTAVHSYNCSLMYQPTYNATEYFDNIIKWRTEMGGE